MITARDLIHPETTQLDRIEAQNLLILELLTKKKTVSKPRVKDDFIMMRPEFVSAAAWEMYIKHRKQKKVAVTEHAYNLIFKKLAEWNEKGHDVDAILKQSVENGWTGLFEIKTNDKPNYRATEITTASHDRVDFNKLRSQELELDATDPYASLKS